MPAAFHAATPILRVKSLAASRAYYTEVLGFAVDWSGPVFASVSRGRCTIFLSEGDQGHPGGWVYVGVADADAVHAELAAKGARIRHEPTNYWWGREVHVEDPDGNVLRFASDVKEGEAPGEWLDMRGDRWAPAEGGGWRKLGPD